MRRMLLATIVVGLAAGMAQAGIITTVTSVGQVTVSSSSTVVDVYKITMTADDPNNKVGAIALGFGTAPRLVDPNEPNEPPLKLTPEMGDDPYQAWYYVMSGMEFKTEYDSSAQAYIAGSGSDPSAAAADTHFLMEASMWTPVVIVADEMNDGSIVPGTGMNVKQGLGALYIQASVKESARLYSHDVCTVGVVAGDTVYGWTYSSDDLGDTTEETFPVPEPATLALLGLGALCLIRRRR